MDPALGKKYKEARDAHCMMSVSVPLLRELQGQHTTSVQDAGEVLVYNASGVGEREPHQMRSCRHPCCVLCG